MKKVYSDWIEYCNNKGERHRTDGPAVECADGDREWFINGQCVADMSTTGKVTIWTKGELPPLIKQSIAMEVLKV